MTKTFTGDVLLPGDAGSGLAATLSLDPEWVTLTAGDNQLGTWSRDDYVITPQKNGSFNLTLGGESVLFRPDSPSEFSSVSAVPLAGSLSGRFEEPAMPVPTSTSSEDDFLDAVVADVRPMRNPLDDGGISRTFVAVMLIVTVVLSVAAVVTASLV